LCLDVRFKALIAPLSLRPNKFFAMWLSPEVEDTLTKPLIQDEQKLSMSDRL
jgi:hypothetical protein